MPRVNAVPATKICEVCGNTWTLTTRYQVRNATCGPTCAGIRISAKRKGEIKRPRVPCQTCGKPTKARPPSKQAKIASAAKYCSRRCWGQTRTEHLTAIAPMGSASRTPESYRAAAMFGEKNPAWKGGVTHRRRRGNYVSVRYVRCPPDLLPMARKDGYIMEHRLVMARWVGRCLTRTETVHHIDHKPLNNPRSNLELWPDNRSHKLAEHGRFVEGATNRLSLTDLAQP